jgi:putative endopeptidase
MERAIFRLALLRGKIGLLLRIAVMRPQVVISSCRSLAKGKLMRPIAYVPNIAIAFGALFLATSLAAQSQASEGVVEGIKVADLDRRIDPCTDFYEYSNGNWRAKNPIPASMDRWSRRWAAGEANKDQLKIILDEVSAKTSQPKGSVDQLIGDFYAACTNEAAVNKVGIEPLQPLLAKVEEVHDRPSLDAAIEALQVEGVQAPFSFSSSPDAHDPQNVIADVGASGLGLPDRDYYVRPEKRFADARAEYLVHVQKMFQLTGTSEKEASRDAQIIMTIETGLAKASLDNVALRDPNATDHKLSFEDLQRLNPSFDWKGYYASAGVTPAALNVDQPSFMKEVERQLAATSIADWKIYLRWQVLNAFADDLSQPFVDENFHFANKQLAGVEELKPRATRCAEGTDRLFGEALGQAYVKRYFPPAAKVRATEMTNNILAAMHDTIEGADWMTAPTKQKAIEKLSTVVVKVGYPDHWKDYSSVDVRRDAYLYDVLGATHFAVAYDRALIGKPLDRSRWGMTPPTSNAYYNPQLNEIVFPAGILQPPAFSVDYADAVNYGAIGVVIGHEISHGFDDQGSQFDAQGRLSKWWSGDDREKFDAKTGCVVKQFDGYTIADGIHLNGKLVLGESIGDLGGVKIGYLAFQKAKQAGHAEPTIDGFTPDQQFFVAWGQFRGDETRLETQKLMVQGDPHPVAKFRVIGPLSNFTPFAETFLCAAGSAMVRPEGERCVVW